MWDIGYKVIWVRIEKILVCCKNIFETFKNQKNHLIFILKTSGKHLVLLDREEIFSKIEDIKKSVKRRTTKYLCITW